MRFRLNSDGGGTGEKDEEDNEDEEERLQDNEGDVEPRVARRILGTLGSDMPWPEVLWPAGQGRLQSSRFQYVFLEVIQHLARETSSELWVPICPGLS